MLDGKFILEEMMVVIIYFLFCDGINVQISQLQVDSCVVLHLALLNLVTDMNLTFSKYMLLHFCSERVYTNCMVYNFGFNNSALKNQTQ